MADGFDFDRDDANRRHLAAHRVTPTEFEELLANEPLDLEYQSIEGEVGYRSVGLTSSGRLLSAVWTIRGGRIRAITAFPASAPDKRAFAEKLK